MTETSQSKFFLTAQPFGGFQGSIQLPDGTRYAGTLWANQSDKGVWYSTGTEQLLVSADHAVLAADQMLKRTGEVHPDLPAEANVKPLELRLNMFREQPDPKTGDLIKGYIGTLYTSRGLFTVFADARTYQGKAALIGSIKPYQPKADVDATVAPKRDEATDRRAARSRTREASPEA